MNHNRILRVLNVLSLSCGYQVHWFSIEARKFQLTLVSCVYFVGLAIWYAICFQQHFAEFSIFFILKEITPVLYQCIRLHLLIGIKVMILVLFETRRIVRTLNDLLKVIPKNRPSSWSRNELVAYFWIFSAILINFGFGMYIMVEMEFLRPTLQQIMHFTAMFLPHFALGCSVKLLNVITWIARIELQTTREEVNDLFKESYQQNVSIIQIDMQNKKNTSVHLSEVPKKPSDTEITATTLLPLTEQLEALANAIQKINETLQKQLMFLFSMNTVCLLGATYTIVYYETSWHLLLAGQIGRTLIAFNSGVFVFIFWDYFCLCITNFYLELEKKTFVQAILQILRRKSTTDKDIKSLLKDMKYTLENKLCMRIFFTSPIEWSTFLVVNTLIGLAIAIFTIFHYFKDQIETLQMQLAED